MESMNPLNLPFSMQNTHTLHPEAIHEAINRKYPKACLVCRTRKVKCDRKLPCGTCKRWNIADCLYPSPIRVSPRPKKDESRSSGKTRDGNDKSLLERVRKLELMVLNLGGSIPAEDSVADLGGQPAHEATPHEDGTEKIVVPQAPKTIQDDVTQVEKGLGKLLVKDAQSRYLSENFWISVDQDEDFDVFVNTPNSASSTAADSVLSQHGYHTFPFSSGTVDINWMHPTALQMQFYWNFFCERVDPLIKVLHKPTLEMMLQADFRTLDKSVMALLFAIYFSAVTSLTDDEVLSNLHLDRAEVIKNYKFATEQALVNANLLETQEIVTLQAFALYLVCSWCNGEVKSVWTMSGLAMRLAQSMGLHRDGTLFELSPLEVENRRRLWWQLWYLDIRTAEDHGSDSNATTLKFDTKLPLNINDSDLHSSSLEVLDDSQGLTDTTFSVIRYRIALTNRKITSRSHYHESLADKEKILDECFKGIEMKYLRYCEGNADTLYWLVENVTRMLMDKSWFMLYHSPTWLQGKASLSRELQERLLVIAIQIIERTQEMENDPRALKWIWLSHNYFQWLPRAFILAELCTRERNDAVDRAWKAINATFDTWSQTTANSKNGILLKRLMAKAMAKREGLSTDESWESFINTDLDLGLGFDPQTGLSCLSAPECSSGGIDAGVQDMMPTLATNLFQRWKQPPSALPEITITNASVHTGDWNHLATDFGAIIQYDGRPRNSYPVIDGGI